MKGVCHACGRPLVVGERALPGGYVGSGGVGDLGSVEGTALLVTLPLRLGRGQNQREHWRTTARRVAAEKAAVSLALRPHTPPAGPWVVTLTRIAPSAGLDSDNLSGSLKASRDAVAGWLGLDDRDPRVTWVYEQRRGPWGVEIAISSRAPEAAP